MESENSDELALANSAGPLAAQLAGLPAPVAQGLLKALYRLAGGLAAYPAAWLQRGVQGVEDGTAARSYLHGELAKAATRQAITDPKIVDRTMWNLLGEGLRKQINREAVIQEAIDNIKSENNAADYSESSDVQDDWMNVFARYADDASSKKMRELWGRVLSREVRNSGSFSLRTLRFLAELDTRTATYFEKFAQEVVYDFCPRHDLGNITGEEFNRIEALETCGLISGLNSSRIKILTPNPTHWSIIFCKNIAVGFKGVAGSRVDINAYLLTDIGREVLHIISDRDERAIIIKWVENLKSHPITSIALFSVERDRDVEIPKNEEIIWSIAP